MNKKKLEKIKIQKVWNSFFKKRTKKLKNNLVEYYYSYVLKIAGKMVSNFNFKFTQNELASLGLDGLYKAIDKYDRTKQTKFETYAYYKIKGAIIDGLRAEDWIPRSVKLRQKSLEQTQHKIEAECGHKAYETTVLENSSMNVNDYHKNQKKYHAVYTSSLEKTVSTEINDNENKKDFNEHLQSKDTSPEGDAIRKEFFSKLMGKDFSDFERIVIYYHYYESLTMKAISEKFELSACRMSQLHRKILKKLQNKIQKNPTYFSTEILCEINSVNNKNIIF